MADKVKRITVDVPEYPHRKVKAKAALLGTIVSDVLRELLVTWEATTEPPKEGRKQDQGLIGPHRCW